MSTCRAVDIFQNFFTTFWRLNYIVSVGELTFGTSDIVCVQYTRCNYNESVCLCKVICDVVSHETSQVCDSQISLGYHVATWVISDLSESPPWYHLGDYLMG